MQPAASASRRSRTLLVLIRDERSDELNETAAARQSVRTFSSAVATYLSGNAARNRCIIFINNVFCRLHREKPREDGSVREVRLVEKKKEKEKKNSNRMIIT